MRRDYLKVHLWELNARLAGLATERDLTAQRHLDVSELAEMKIPGIDQPRAPQRS